MKTKAYHFDPADDFDGEADMADLKECLDHGDPLCWLRRSAR